MRSISGISGSFSVELSYFLNRRFGLHCSVFQITLQCNENFTAVRSKIPLFGSDKNKRKKLKMTHTFRKHVCLLSKEDKQWDINLKSKIIWTHHDQLE